MAIIETHLFTQYTSYGFSETLVAFAFSVYGVGAMLGGICVTATGSYPLIWCASMALSAGAAALSFTIRENGKTAEA